MQNQRKNRDPCMKMAELFGKGCIFFLEEITGTGRDDDEIMVIMMISVVVKVIMMIIAILSDLHSTQVMNYRFLVSLTSRM